VANNEQAATPRISPFDAIRHTSDALGEYWSARELYKILGYTQWRNFQNVVIQRAMKACAESRREVSDHFVQSYKMVTLGSGSQRKTEDVLLSRYAAYLVVMKFHCSVTRGKEEIITPPSRQARRRIEQLPDSTFFRRHRSSRRCRSRYER
jgi:hypothetical protein